MPQIQGGSGLLSGIHIFQAVLSPAIVNANTSAEQSLVVPQLPNPVTAPGLIMVVIVNKPTAQAGLGIVGARVIDATHIGITFMNDTAAGITPTAAEVYTFAVLWFQT